MNPEPDSIALAAKIGADRVELYTESYAAEYATNKEEAIKPFIEAALVAQEVEVVELPCKAVGSI